MLIDIVLNVKDNLSKVYLIELQNRKLINKKFDNLYKQNKIV